jgi:hypothetical protein
MQAGVYAYEPNSVLVEVDWDKERSTVHRPDQALFESRKSNGFDHQVTNQTLLGLFS